MTFKKALCSLLCITTTVMGIQSSLMSTAVAATPICDTYTSTAECAVIRTGSSSVAVPRIQWTPVSQDVSQDAQRLLTSTSDLDQNLLRGNSSAALMGMSPSSVAKVVSGFPVNVPIVIGRYEPVNMMLRVDVFKVEKTIVDGKTQRGLYQMTFTPAYGNYWKAMGTYMSPAQRAAGTNVGPNPFERFQNGSADTFNNITLKGAMVAIGHAQRLVGAPASLLVNLQPSVHQYTTKSGNIFRKTVTSHADYSVTPQYFVGAPQGLQGGVTTSFCATDPSAASCSAYEVAASGVSFQQITGGNMQESSQPIYNWQESQSGWTLLAIFVIALVVGFAFAQFAPAALGGAAGGSANITAGFWTNVMSSTIGGISGTTPLTAALMEAGIYTGVSGALGGGFGGMYGMGAGNLAFAPDVSYQEPTNPEHVSAVNFKRIMATNGTVAGTVQQSVTAVRTQIQGNCDPSSLLRDCAPSATAGIIPHADQLTPFKGLEFIRDNGKPTKASSLGGL